MIEEVTIEEDAIYSISGDFKYLSAIVENVKCTSNTRLWYEVNGVQSVFDNIQSSYTGKGYIACKANDYVQVGYSGSGTWTNPMAKKMSNKIVNGNIKNVSISLGGSPNTSPLLAGTKVTVYGIRA